jgi:hypothetical protein
MKYFLLLILCCLTGCAKLANINELLTLKAVADEQKRHDEYVADYDARFKSLIEAHKNGTVSEYRNKRGITKRYGKPIFVEETVMDGQTVEKWVYRQAVKYFDSDYVHIYFDQEGRFVKSEYLPFTSDVSSNNKM